MKIQKNPYSSVSKKYAFMPVDSILRDPDGFTALTIITQQDGSPKFLQIVQNIHLRVACAPRDEAHYQSLIIDQRDRLMAKLQSVEGFHPAQGHLLEL